MMADRDHPVIIIGAARSGTNMLRDILARLPGFGTWPCDEINYVWRHGHRAHPSDELTPEDAEPRVRSFIRRQFRRIGAARHASTIVEKTCANSLRVGFVDAVFPEARFVFIYRDGRDVVASALKRWRAPFEPAYVLAKARYVPLSDVPYYASRYAVSRVYRLFSREKRLKSWGPRFVGMEKALAEYSLPEVAAMQWSRSVERSLDAFEKLDPQRVIRAAYEDVVSRPGEEVSRILDFLNTQIPAEKIRELTSGLSADSVGRWEKDLDDMTKAQIAPIVAPMLKRLGYIPLGS